MARSVRNARLGLAVGERHRHESGAEIVNADGLANRAALEELRPRRARGVQVPPQLPRELIDVQPASFLLKDGSWGLSRTP